MDLRLILVSSAALVVAAGPAQAKLVAEWCEALKLRAVGAYERCLFEAEAAALLRGGEPEVGRCASRLARRFARAEAATYGECPTQGDEAALQDAAETYAGEVAAALSGPGDPEPARKCGAAKVRSAGAHAACRFAAEASGIARGGASDPGSCDAKLAVRFARAEARGGGACPTTGDRAEIQQDIATHVEEIVDTLGGPAPLCGNGILSSNESCDQSDFGGLDCVMLGYAGGDLACDAYCRLDSSPCVPAPPCDLLAQDCPLTGYGCYPVHGGNRCLPAGSSAAGGECGAPTDCQPGLHCFTIHSGAASRCLPFCDPAAPICSAGESCVDLASGFGVCLGSP
jgi:hypothetical protein